MIETCSLIPKRHHFRLASEFVHKFLSPLVSVRIDPVLSVTVIEPLLFLKAKFLMNLVNDIEAFKRFRHADTFFITFYYDAAELIDQHPVTVDSFCSPCFARNVSCFDLILGNLIVDGKEDNISSTSFRTSLISSINNDLNDVSLSDTSLLTSLVSSLKSQKEDLECFLPSVFSAARQLSLAHFGIKRVQYLLSCDLKGCALAHSTSTSNKCRSTMFGGIHEHSIFARVLGSHESHWIGKNDEPIRMDLFQKTFKLDVAAKEIFRLLVRKNTTTELCFDGDGLPTVDKWKVLDLRGESRVKLFHFLQERCEGLNDEKRNKVLAELEVNVKCPEVFGSISINPVHNLSNIGRHVSSFFVHLFVSTGMFEIEDVMTRTVHFFTKVLAPNIGESVRSIIVKSKKDKGSSEGLRRVHKCARLIGRNSIMFLRHFRSLLEDLFRYADEKEKRLLCLFSTFTYSLRKAARIHKEGSAFIECLQTRLFCLEALSLMMIRSLEGFTQASGLLKGQSI